MVMSVSVDRLARNQLVLREVNDRIYELLQGFGCEPGLLADFVCECSQTDCVQSVELALAEYKAIRSTRTLLVVRPGHEATATECVVETTSRFTLVEPIRKLHLVGDSDRPSSNGRAS